jgi:hypothetical protein
VVVIGAVSGVERTAKARVAGVEMRRKAILSCGFRRYNPQKPGKNRELGKNVGNNARRPMKKSDFNFDLPPELVAQAPCAPRNGARRRESRFLPCFWGL